MNKLFDLLFVVGGVFLYALAWALLIFVGIFLLPFAALGLLVFAVYEIVWWHKMNKEWEMQS
jgi:hypothetical protein